MRFLIAYMLKYYVRTFKYVPILLVFPISLALVYSYKPLSVGYNYAFTSDILFLFSAWITLGFMDLEDTVQQQLTILHINNDNYYYLAQIAAVFSVTFILNVCLVFFPILFNHFNRPVTAADMLAAVLAHAITSLLGISVAAFFNSRLLPDRKTAILMLTLFLAFCYSTDSTYQGIFIPTVCSVDITAGLFSWRVPAKIEPLFCMEHTGSFVATIFGILFFCFDKSLYMVNEEKPILSQ